MHYTASLDGSRIASGTAQDIQTAVSTALTDFLAQDPEGVAMSAMSANQAFQDGATVATLPEGGHWDLPLWVHGERHTIKVTREA